MGEYEFSLAIEGLGDNESGFDELYAVGCDDATFGSIDSAGYGEFSRQAESLFDAVLSAISDVESVAGLRVLRVEPDDLVTMSDIATRLGRTRESVRLLIVGKRGGGGFPPPISHLRSRSRLWRWSDVACWAGETDAADDAAIIAAVNAALELRNRTDRVAPQLKRRVRKLAS